MATENLDGIFSWPAAADYSAAPAQYSAVIYNTSGQVVLAGVNALGPIGLLHNNPKAGEMARVVLVRGVIAKARAGAAFAVKALLTTDSTGRLVTATTGQNVCAIASKAAGAANSVVEVIWLGNNGVAP